MNHIEIKKMQTPYRYKENFWVIDGKALPEYLNEWALESKDTYLKSIGSFFGLYPAWGKGLDYKGDIRFVWKLIEMDSAVLPLLLCSDDLDFSCIVMVVDVEKTKDFVYWRRIGYVLHEKEDFKEEKKCGILYLESYSDEDWEKYGDNIALEQVDSLFWKQWISENWEEELFRRRMNYTLPFYQTEGNVCWIKNVEWAFDRFEYDKMVNQFWQTETINQLQNFNENNVMSIEKCANMLADLTPEGKQRFKEHLKDFNEILLHVLAGDLITEPLIDLLKHHMDRKTEIQIYCKAIEVMRKNGDDEVVNVVDVTILERLSDEECVWERFGIFLSEEFRNYINDEVLGSNLMMGGIKLVEKERDE
ncbi:MAG: hypothetical protein IJA32_05345 [Lachnospiraceae bacterium]|nr:hypothetical protein [Lachnospiraceae bacterium]